MKQPFARNRIPHPNPVPPTLTLSQRERGIVGGGRLFCALLCAVWSTSASAQVDPMPEPGYYVAVNEFYAGQYRQAERAFRRMTRSGVQAAQARWIDSICYHAMLGEVLYQQGRNGEALQSFDQACLLLLTYPDFMKRAQFEDPRPEANPQRAVPPWGVGTRRMALGDYPRAMQVMVGELDRGAAGAAAGRDISAGAVLARECGGGDSHECAGHAAAERDVGAAGEARSNFERVGDDDGAAESRPRRTIGRRRGRNCWRGSPRRASAMRPRRRRGSIGR